MRCRGVKLITVDFEFCISSISEIFGCSFRDLVLDFLRQQEPTQNSANTVHAHQQRLSSHLGAHSWHSTTSTPTWPQRDPTFSIWQFTFRPSCNVVVLVSDFSFGGIDLKHWLALVHAARLGHLRAAGASSWPSLSSSSTWAQWCSEFLHFHPIFHFLKSTSDSRQNISAHETMHQNRPKLVDAAHQGLSNAPACCLCQPAAAVKSWQY